jgi:hypothetical protein
MTQSGVSARRVPTGWAALGRHPALLLGGIFVFLLLLTLFLYGEVLSYSMLGHDSYPIIAAARIENTADALGTFSEELMDGRYPKGHFYRPVLNLSIAMDYALYGLAPLGYHLTDLLLITVAAFLLLLLVRRFAFEGAMLVGLFAGFFLICHPVLLNILPVPARRGDTLAVVFLLAALLSSTTRRAIPALVGTGVFSLLAVGAKETGALAVPLILLLSLARSRRPGADLPRALLAALPAAAAVIVFIIARHAVIGGLGGHRTLTSGAVVEVVGNTLVLFVRNAVLPRAFDLPLLRGPEGLWIVLALLLAGGLLVIRGASRIGLTVFSLIWMLLSLGIHGFSGMFQPWYVIHMVVPLALLFGLLGMETWRSLRSARSTVGRVCAAALACLLLLLLVGNIRDTSVFCDHPEWRVMTESSGTFLNELRGRLEGLVEGEVTVETPLPFVAPTTPGSPIFIATGLADYSVEAWAQMAFSAKRIRVASPSPTAPHPRSGEIVVYVQRRR